MKKYFKIIAPILIFFLLYASFVDTKVGQIRATLFDIDAVVISASPYVLTSNFGKDPPRSYKYKIIKEKFKILHVVKTIKNIERSSKENTRPDKRGYNYITIVIKNKPLKVIEFAFDEKNMIHNEIGHEENESYKYIKTVSINPDSYNKLSKIIK